MNDLRKDEYERIRLTCRRLQRTRSYRSLDLDDLVQETALRVISGRHGMSFLDRHARIAAGNMLDELMTRRNEEYPSDLRRPEKSMDLPDPRDDIAHEVGLRGDVERALRSLTTRQAEVARLHGMHGWPLDAVASRFEVSQRGVVQRIWKRARSRLRLALGQYRVYD